MTGIICLDKPAGMTSFGAVARMRRIANEKKIGHCGTLDPMATGVLPLLLGHTTRFLEFLPDSGKHYRARIRLGTVTDTLDITGEVLETHEVSACAEDILNLLPRFRGEIMQVPPMYSAISKNGVRLYELARKGIEVEREARPVTISSLELTDADDAAHEYELEISCSKGTYIRTLAHDIGAALGCGAVMTALRRTTAAGFGLGQCLTLEQAQEYAENGTLEQYILPLESALGAYPRAQVTAAQGKRFSNGGELALDRVHVSAPDGAFVCVYCEDKFLGMGEISLEKQQLSVKRVYARGQNGCE